MVFKNYKLNYEVTGKKNEKNYLQRILGGGIVRKPRNLLPVARRKGTRKTLGGN